MSASRNRRQAAEHLRAAVDYIIDEFSGDGDDAISNCEIVGMLHLEADRRSMMAFRVMMEMEQDEDDEDPEDRESISS